MSEQRTSYHSDQGEQLSPKPAEVTLQAIKDVIAEGEQAGQPASNTLVLIHMLLKEGWEGQRHD